MKKLVIFVVLFALTLATFVTPGRTPVYADSSGTLKLTPCKYTYGLADPKQTEDAQCGTLQVPQDRSNPGGTNLNISVVVLPARQPANKGLPIFHFEGGPGGSAISNWGKVWYIAYRGLREHHDVVLIDQRGIGQSTSLQCNEIVNGEFNDLGKTLTPQQNYQTTVDRLKQCLSRLSRTVDPAFFTSASMADDTDDVRAALGYDQINIFGNSYGTWLGQIYLGRHGDHVHAIILDSVVGPWNNYLLDSGNNADAALNKIFALCKKDAQCAGKYPNSAAQLAAILKGLGAKPVTVVSQGTSIVMTSGRFLSVLHQMLYEADLIGLIPSEIDKAAKGDFTTFGTVLYEVAKGATDVSIGLFYSVNCSESIPFYTPALVKKYQKQTVFGSAQDVFNEYNAICNIWPSAKLSSADVAPVKSTRPVLIFSGAFDPITPVSYGQEADKRLTKSTLAVFPFHAHGPMVTSKCAQIMALAFFDTPDKAVNTTCAAKDVQPIFVGAYKVSLVAYTDPKGAFAAQIPKGWKVDKKTSTGQLTFFNSPDNVQILGLAILKNMDMTAAKNLVFAEITKAYGAIDIQLNLNVLTITAIQHTLDRPSEIYTGLLFMRRVGADNYILWQAAPTNIINAVAIPVSVPVLLSLQPKK